MTSFFCVLCDERHMTPHHRMTCDIFNMKLADYPSLGLFPNVQVTSVTIKEKKNLIIRTKNPMPT